MWIVQAFFAAAVMFMCWITAYMYYQQEYNQARLAFGGVVFFLVPICVFLGRRLSIRRRANQLCNEHKLLYAPICSSTTFPTSA